MDRSKKTHRTLFIEEHHEKHQREARAEEAFRRMMSDDSEASTPSPRNTALHAHHLHGHSSHMLLNKHDSDHHWAGLMRGSSWDEQDTR